MRFFIILPALLAAACTTDIDLNPCLVELEDRPGVVMDWGDFDGPEITWDSKPVEGQIVFLDDVELPVDGVLMVSVAVESDSAWAAPAVRWVLQAEDTRHEGFTAACVQP